MNRDKQLAQAVCESVQLMSPWVRAKPRNSAGATLLIGVVVFALLVAAHLAAAGAA